MYLNCILCLKNLNSNKRHYREKVNKRDTKCFKCNHGWMDVYLNWFKDYFEHSQNVSNLIMGNEVTLTPLPKFQLK